MMSDKDNNLLKSDILTVGSELSEKLNAMGVPNTFGKASEGKDNLMSIIRMTINRIDTTIDQIREILRDYYNKSEVNTLLNGKSDTSHNHDSAYANISHNHDKAYANISHNHDKAYAKISHNHDSAYASKSHQHEGADVILSNNNNVDTEIGTIENNITSINGDITSLSDSITNHTTTFTDMIEKHTWSIPAFSLEKGKGVEKKVTVPNPSGYFRVPIIQGAYKCSASSLSLSGTTLTVKIQNHYSSNANASMYGVILYFKLSIFTEI